MKHQMVFLVTTEGDEHMEEMRMCTWKGREGGEREGRDARWPR